MKKSFLDQTLSSLSKQDENEHNWLKMNNIFEEILKADQKHRQQPDNNNKPGSVTNGNKYGFNNKNIKPEVREPLPNMADVFRNHIFFLLRCLLSDRSRLSGSALNLLKQIIENEDVLRGCSAQAMEQLLEACLKLCKRANRIFNKRGEELIVLITEKYPECLIRHGKLIKMNVQNINKKVRKAVFMAIQAGLTAIQERESKAADQNNKVDGGIAAITDSETGCNKNDGANSMADSKNDRIKNEYNSTDRINKNHDLTNRIKNEYNSTDRMKNENKTTGPKPANHLITDMTYTKYLNIFTPLLSTGQKDADLDCRTICKKILQPDSTIFAIGKMNKMNVPVQREPVRSNHTIERIQGAQQQTAKNNQTSALESLRRSRADILIKTDLPKTVQTPPQKQIRQPTHIPGNIKRKQTVLNKPVQIQTNEQKPINYTPRSLNKYLDQYRDDVLRLKRSPSERNAAYHEKKFATTENNAILSEKKSGLAENTASLSERKANLWIENDKLFMEEFKNEEVAQTFEMSFDEKDLGVIEEKAPTDSTLRAKKNIISDNDGNPFLMGNKNGTGVYSGQYDGTTMSQHLNKQIVPQGNDKSTFTKQHTDKNIKVEKNASMTQQSNNYFLPHRNREDLKNQPTDFHSRIGTAVPRLHKMRNQSETMKNTRVNHISELKETGSMDATRSQKAIPNQSNKPVQYGGEYKMRKGSFRPTNEIKENSNETVGEQVNEIKENSNEPVGQQVNEPRDKLNELVEQQVNEIKENLNETVEQQVNEIKEKLNETMEQQVNEPRENIELAAQEMDYREIKPISERPGVDEYPSTANISKITPMVCNSSEHTQNMEQNSTIGAEKTEETSESKNMRHARPIVHLSQRRTPLYQKDNNLADSKDHSKNELIYESKDKNKDVTKDNIKSLPGDRASSFSLPRYSSNFSPLRIFDKSKCNFDDIDKITNKKQINKIHTISSQTINIEQVHNITETIYRKDEIFNGLNKYSLNVPQQNNTNIAPQKNIESVSDVTQQNDSDISQQKNIKCVSDVPQQNDSDIPQQKNIECVSDVTQQNDSDIPQQKNIECVSDVPQQSYEIKDSVNHSQNERCPKISLNTLHEKLKNESILTLEPDTDEKKSSTDSSNKSETDEKKGNAGTINKPEPVVPKEFEAEDFSDTINVQNTDKKAYTQLYMVDPSSNEKNDEREGILSFLENSFSSLSVNAEQANNHGEYVNGSVLDKSTVLNKTNIEEFSEIGTFIEFNKNTFKRREK